MLSLLRLVLLAALSLLILCEGPGETDALLKIARDFRDGSDGAVRSLLRATRFYELLIERADSLTEGDIAKFHQRDAEFELSEILELDPTLSSRYSYLEMLIRAAAGGHAEAQHKLSVIYATGVAARDLTPMDAGSSLFLEYMSALSGNVMANLGMAYRYHMGIGVKGSCDASLPHYEYAADHAVLAIQKNAIISQMPDTLRLSETNDPSNRFSRRDGTLELADYYSHLAEQGDAMAAVSLGNMFLSGTRYMAANVSTALHFFSLASDMQNPVGAGLHGYVLLAQYLRDVEDIIAKDGLKAARKYSQSVSGMVRAEKFLKLLQFANKKSDVHGVLGMGIIYFHGVGLSANISRAIDHLERTVGAHGEAGFYIGEICMGLKSWDLTSDGDLRRPGQRRAAKAITSSEVATDGIMKGKDSAEVRALESHVIRVALQQKDIDPMAASHAYTVAAQFGHVLAQHRLAHLQQRGLGIPASCKETAKLFKTVAERGPWMDNLAVAHQYYSEGNEMGALNLFTQLAAVGVESAQYNAAYILSKCIRCPPGHKNLNNAAAAGSTSMDPLEKQHRSLRRSTATNFRALLKMHDEYEEGKQNDTNTLAHEDAELVLQQGGGPSMKRTIPSGPSVLSSTQAKSPWVRSVAYLPAATWRKFLSSYMPDSLVDALDLEFAPAVATEAAVASKERTESIRITQCEARALTLFDLSAQQGNAEAYSQLGDFYYYQRAGLVQAERKKEAALFYQKAADLQHTQAIFNLGIMHEVGDGVSQDFHLAKRYYDQAAEVDGKARVPRDVALLLLEGHKTINAIFGPQAVAQLMSSTIFVPVSWSLTDLRPFTVWEVLQGIAAVDRKMRRYIDDTIIWYNEKILRPSKDQLNVLGAPFQSSLFSSVGKFQHENEAGHALSDENTPRRNSASDSVGVQRKMAGIPTMMRVFYDRLFEEGFLFTYELARGKPHDRLSEHEASHVPVMQLREDFLVILLLCAAFVFLYILRQVRRRLALNIPANLPDLQDFDDLQVMEGLQDMQDIQNIPDLPDDIRDIPDEQPQPADAEMADALGDFQDQLEHEPNRPHRHFPHLPDAL